MKTTIKYPTDTTVLVSFALEKQELDDAKQAALVKIAKDLKVQGFRKGKVPVTVAAKHADPRLVSEETVEAAISKAVASYFIDEKIQALDRPAVELKKYVPDETLEFTAETEVIPKVTLGDYKHLTAKAETKKIGDNEVKEVLDRMREGMAEKAAVKRAAKMGDETVIDFEGLKDDVAFEGGTATDYALTLGSNTFIPGFEEGVVGKKAGEKFDLPLKFPLDYQVEDLKGTEVIFRTTLKEVKEKKLPELDDAFAKKAGPFETLTQLKADIKKELSEQAKHEATEKRKDALVSELAEKSKAALPKILIEDQIKSLKQDFMQNLMYQGMSVDQYIKSSGFKDEDEWTAKELTPAAEKRVRIGLVLAELSKAEKIQATSEELAEFINKYRSSYANNPEILKQFDDPQVQHELANRLLTEKTVDRLVELNK